MKIIVTGAAGFIGFHTCLKLIKQKFKVIGIDNINDYYDQNLKLNRLHKIDEYVQEEKGFWKFFKCSLEDDIHPVKFSKNSNLM